MCIGLTTANSILVVTFANQRMAAGEGAQMAALAAGYTRLRPVLMTAGAMILGMIPMALGVGEGGEQNAPLARAVIGGLMFATAATMIFVPVVYRMLRRDTEPWIRQEARGRLRRTSRSRTCQSLPTSPRRRVRSSEQEPGLRGSP